MGDPIFDNPQNDRSQSAKPALPGTCAPFLLAGTGNGNGTSPVGQRWSRDRASASYITGLQLFTGFETMFAAQFDLFGTPILPGFHYGESIVTAVMERALKIVRASCRERVCQEV